MTSDDTATSPAQADLPSPTPGATLAARREEMGIAAKDLAKRLGIHRVTLSVLEHEPKVDPVRAARYERALRELVAEAVAP